jgi:Arc/MetJ-type ribon-helix-helix transcriptional regulator
MNAIVKKAFDKLSELPEPMQKTVARKLLADVEKWLALKRDVDAGFASGPATQFNVDEFKKEARRRMSAKRRRNAQG